METMNSRPAMILFPAIDLKDGLAVRLEQGDMTRATIFHRDPAEQAHGVVRSLSREDFGPRAVKITPTGVLRPPAR